MDVRGKRTGCGGTWANLRHTGRCPGANDAVTRFQKRSCRGCLFGDGRSRRQPPRWRLSGSSCHKTLRYLLASNYGGFSSTWSRSYRDTRTTSMACSACHRPPGPIDDPDRASLSTHPRIPFAASVTVEGVPWSVLYARDEFSDSGHPGRVMRDGHGGVHASPVSLNNFLILLI
jgi:hypothetical protein